MKKVNESRAIKSFNQHILSRNFKYGFILLFWIILFSSNCTRSIALYDQYAYTHTTIIKVDALNLMSLAVEKVSDHKDKIDNFMNDLQKLYEYEKGRPRNEITVKQWDLLLNPEGHLLGGFIARWNKEEKLNQTFVDEAKKLVSNAFDLISGLESGKLKPSDIK